MLKHYCTHEVRLTGWKHINLVGTNAHAMDGWNEEAPRRAAAMNKEPSDVFFYVDQEALRYDERELNMLRGGDTRR